MRDYNVTVCECEDGGCQADEHATARGRCEQRSRQTLYRIDMQDHDGVRFCDECADDAAEAGEYASQRNSYS